MHQTYPHPNALELATDPIEEPPHQVCVIESSVYFEQNEVRGVDTETYYDQHKFL